MTTAAASPDLHHIEGLLYDQDFWYEQRQAWAERMAPLAREVFRAGYIAAKTAKPQKRRRRKAFWRKAMPNDELDALDLTDTAGQVFETYMDDWWAALEKTTRDKLRAALLRASDTGGGTAQVIDEITPLFGEARASLIGVTETTRLFGQGAVASFREDGLGGWVWMTAQDDRVDEDCDVLDGQEFGIDEDFEPQHPNCRCWPAPLSEA